MASPRALATRAHSLNANPAGHFMPTRLANTLEMLANVSIIIAAVLFSTVTMRLYLTRDVGTKPQSISDPVAQKLMQKGDLVSVSNLTLPQNEQTLLLALSTTCHFCTDSASFYQRISKEHGATHLLAVFPQTLSEGETYLSRLGVKVDEVKQVSFGELGVTGTPTLALIDRGGRVINTWEGILPPSTESEVLERIKQEARNRSK